MSAEVVDSNPYSRLMALQRMGIVDNYERIRDFSVAIVVRIKLFISIFFFYVMQNLYLMTNILISLVKHKFISKSICLK